MIRINFGDNEKYECKDMCNSGKEVEKIKYIDDFTMFFGEMIDFNILVNGCWEVIEIPEDIASHNNFDYFRCF